jgi:uncharacterized protein
VTARAVPAEARMVEMKVSQLTVDPLTNMPIVILRDEAGKESVPIWIGLPEASAIATQLEKVELCRPIAHDLMKTIIGECGLRVDHVEVRDVKDHTFYASIFLEKGGSMIELDSRPSDAIALALRTGSSIRVARKVVEKTRKLGAQLATADANARKGVMCGGDSDFHDADRHPDLLALLSDDDFGKWKM